jgi:spectrin beta
VFQAQGADGDGVDPEAAPAGCALTLLFTEADGVEQWIAEKEKMLDTMVAGKDMKHRLDGFNKEMNASASR